MNKKSPLSGLFCVCAQADHKKVSHLCTLHPSRP
nr:MAG TPA: hypothetical protein [Caudoviricetes sp.]